MKRVLVLEKATTSGIVQYLNENFTKKNGREFNRNDLTWFIKDGRLPRYLGNFEIVKNNENKYCTLNVYDIWQIIEED